MELTHAAILSAKTWGAMTDREITSRTDRITPAAIFARTIDDVRKLPVNVLVTCCFRIVSHAIKLWQHKNDDLKRALTRHLDTIYGIPSLD